MAGGLMQLAAFGIENLYLTEQPQITFFKTIYYRHTAFSIESMPQYFNVSPNFSDTVSCIISPNADLINKVYVVVTLPAINNTDGVVCRWVNNIGYTIIDYVELEIGGKIIDKEYGEWLFIWNELNKTNTFDGLNKMIGNVPELTEFSTYKDEYTLYIPLQFWFCRHQSLSLPIIALQHSEVKINVKFSPLENCIIAGPTHYIYLSDAVCLFSPYELISVNSSYIQFINFDESTMQLGYIKLDPTVELAQGDVLVGCTSKYKTTVYSIESNLYSDIIDNSEILNLTPTNSMFRNIFNLTISDAFLFVDYIYLDRQERNNFLKNDHLYLVDYCQYDNEKIVYNVTNKIKLGYSHPTKELYVRAQLQLMVNNNDFYRDHYNFTTSFNKTNGKSLINKILIKINGNKRETDYNKNFYTNVQTYQHHKTFLPKGLFIYSFSLYPHELQPSAAFDFSKAEDISIDVTLETINYNNPANIRIYALSYNILKISNGVGCLLFN